MADNDLQEAALQKVLRRQKELQETIKTATNTIREAMQELERIKIFLDVLRSASAQTGTVASGGSDSRSPVSRKLKGHAHGQTQEVFQAFALDILRDVGRPMKSTEFIEEFRRRGQPLGGNEVRTAWNRLWHAKRAGLLTYDVKFGYWIPDEPLTEEMKSSAVAASKRNRGKAPSLRDTKGKPKGPPRALTPEQVKEIERLLLSGKTRKEVCELYGGISMATLAKYLGRTEDFLAQHPGVVIPKRPPRPGHRKGTGRPRSLKPEQEQRIVDLKEQGKSVPKIVELTGVKRGLVYAVLQRRGVPASGSK